MRFILSICILLVSIPLFAQTEEIDDAVLLRLLKQRDNVKQQMSEAEKAGDNAKYEELKALWDELDAKANARKELIQSSQKEAKRLLDEASSLRRDGKYAQAQAKYEKVLAYSEFINEKIILDVRFKIADCLERQKKYPAALELYSKVIESNPDLAKAYGGKARVLSKMGQNSESISVFHKAIELDPDNYQDYFFLAGSYEKIGMSKESEENYLTATQKNPSYYQAWYSLGKIRYKMKKYDDAIKALKSAVESDKRYTKYFHKAYTLMAQIYNTVGNYTSAIDASESALELKSNYGRAHLERGIALQKTQRYNLAIQSFEKCLNDRECRDSAQWHINLIKEKYLEQ